MRRHQRAKYRSEPVVVNGIRFASKKEAARYNDLELLCRAGEIRDLELQPRFKLLVQDCLICRYVADFKYFDPRKNATVVEDVKGFRTREYILKSKMFRALYPQFVFIET